MSLFNSQPSRLFLIRAALLPLILGISVISYADNQNYYINNTVTCNNTNAGTAPETPWCDIEKVNTVDFGPGDTIHLARGAVWENQGMIFDENDNGNGNTNGEVTIRAYGSTSLPLPHITTTARLAADQVLYRGIVLKNAGHWIIRDVEISHVAVGIFFYYTNRGVNNEGYEDISLSYLKLHHIYGYEKYLPTNEENIEFSAGILFRGINSLEQNIGDKPVVKNVTIDRVEGYRNQNSITFSIGKKCVENGGDASCGTAKANAAQNVMLNHLYLHDEDANGQSTSCSDSLRLVRMAKVTLMNSVITRAGGCFSNSGTTAIFLGYTASASIINNNITHTAFTGSQDESAIDLEIANGDTRIYGNLFSGNQMGTECMMFRSNEACIFYISNNGYIKNRRSAMFINGNKNLATGEFTNNFQYGLPGSYLTYQEVDGKPSTQNLYSTVNTSGNIILPNADNFYSASGDFSTNQTRWSYEYFANNTWIPLSYDSGLKLWNRSTGDTGLYVSTFEMKPASGYFVARVWTAPKAGTISILGQIAKSDTNPAGNGIFSRIEKNDAVIWPTVAPFYYSLARSNTLGVSTNVIQLHVQENDKIRFEIASNGNDIGDTTSWAPMIAYTDGPASIVWQFDTPGVASVKNTTGWLEFWGKADSPSDYNHLTRSVELKPSSSTEGELKLVITGNDPWIRSRYTNHDAEAIDGAIYRYMTISLKHNTAATSAKLSWITKYDQTWDSQKEKVIPLGSGADYQTLTLDMENTPHWTGEKIWQLRLHPINDSTISSGLVDIDYIRLDQTAPQ